jgi:hypothetical protein
MVSLNIQVNQCENCGRYFALTKGLYQTKYCSRLYGDRGYTCKAIGAMKKYTGKLSFDPTHKLYRTTYKRLHARKSTNKITEEVFEQQKRKIAQLQQDTKNGKITIEDYKAQMSRI